MWTLLLLVSAMPPSEAEAVAEAVERQMETALKAVADWQVCTDRMATNLARRSTEGADVVADAALGLCAREASIVRNSYLSAGFDIEVSNRKMELHMLSQRRVVIATIVTLRLQDGS